MMFAETTEMQQFVGVNLRPCSLILRINEKNKMNSTKTYAIFDVKFD